MCIKQINNLVINHKSAQSAMVLDKYSDKNEQLFGFDNEDSSSDDVKTSYENQQNQHNLESNGSYCKYCLAKLAFFQIDIDQSIRLCSNSECSRFKNNNNDLGLFHIELVKNGSNQSHDQALKNESADLELILRNFSTLAYKIIDQGLERYQNHQSNHQENITFNEDYSNNLINNTHNNQLHIAENNQIKNSVLNEIDTGTKQPVFQQQQSVLFNDNFFSDINSLLTQDYENNYNTMVNNTENVNCVYNNNQDTIDWMSFDDTTTTLANLDNNFFDLLDQQQPASQLEPLKPTNTSKLAAQLASDSLSNDFLDNFLGDDHQPIELAASFLPSPNKDDEIISNAKTKNGASSILITKKKQTNKTDQPINKQAGKFEIAISSTKLKLADGEDLELLELMSKPNPQSKIQPTATKPHFEEKKPFESSPSKKLLSWEIKNKDYKKKNKSVVEQDTPNVTTSSSSPFSSSQNKLNGLSAMSRYQNSITKADLSQKSKKMEENLKEKGAELKQALLQNKSFLSTTTEFTKNIVTKPSGVGYKDLVLSVLKKKTTT